jgi:hypothetical protein
MIIKSHPNTQFQPPTASAGNIADDFDLNKLEKASKMVTSRTVTKFSGNYRKIKCTLMISYKFLREPVAKCVTVRIRIWDS